MTQTLTEAPAKFRGQVLPSGHTSWDDKIWTAEFNLNTLERTGKPVKIPLWKEMQNNEDLHKQGLISKFSWLETDSKGNRIPPGQRFEDMGEFERQVEDGSPVTEAGGKSFDEIRPGDKLTIMIPSGMGRGGQEFKPKSGKVVMKGPAGWVLNMGGRHGTPGIVTPSNTTKINGKPVQEPKVESFEEMCEARVSDQGGSNKVFRLMITADDSQEFAKIDKKIKSAVEHQGGVIVAYLTTSRTDKAMEVLVLESGPLFAKDQLERWLAKFTSVTEGMVSEAVLSESPRLDGIEKEKGIKLLQRLQKAVRKKMDSLPNTAPISLQIMKSIFAIDKAMIPHYQKRGVEAVNAFILACSGHFTDGFDVLSGLKRKYRLDSDFSGNLVQITTHTGESMTEAKGAPIWRTAQVFAKNVLDGETLLNTLPNLKRPNGKSLSSGGFVSLRPDDDERDILKMIAKQIRRKPQELRLAIVGESMKEDSSDSPFEDMVDGVHENTGDVVASALHDVVTRHKGTEIQFAAKKRDEFRKLEKTTRIPAEKQRAKDAVRTWSVVIGRLQDLGFY